MSSKNKAQNMSQVAKGKVAEKAGQASGNEQLEAQGLKDQTQGHMKQAGEEIKDAIKN